MSASPRERRPDELGPRERRPRDWLRARLRRLRPIHIALIAVAVVLFLAVSVLLARFLSTENAERDRVLSVLVAQAAGNAQEMLAKLDGCRSHPSCLAIVRADAARLRRPGPVKILSLTSHTAYSLTSSSGKTRVAWTVIGRSPVVQCLQVRRTGSFLEGMAVHLSSIGAPIPGEADC